jgi:hypothetical protein
MKKLNINESFISRIWETTSYYESVLLTTESKVVEVLDYGEKNLDAGPDFKDAQIRIDGILYSGDIEIHQTFKNWKEHNHKGDNKYNKVVLQVVFWDEEKDCKKILPKVKKAREIPTIILSKFLKQSIHSIWKEIINNPSQKFKLPCFPENHKIDINFKKKVIYDLSYKRLQYKTLRIKNRLENFEETRNKKSTWEKILFEFICEALGYSKNKAQFLKLAKSLVLSELPDDKLFIDAVLYGSAGFLYNLRFKDDYISLMKVIWSEMENKNYTSVLDKSEWNFFRLRPSNFPTVRIAYASGLLHVILYKNFLKNIVTIFNEEDKVYQKLVELFLNIEISDYWKNHYNFGKETKSKTKYIGKERINDIITNVIIPFIYFYSLEFDIFETQGKVLNFYDSLKCISTNEITRVMSEQLELKPNTIADEQGLIHLHNFYCMKGKCYDCKIGEKIFEVNRVSEPMRIIIY